MKILLVEDDQLLRDLYDDALSQAGHQVLQARHAQEAVTMLDEYGAEIIIMDMMLPGHNGLEILHELQTYNDWQQLPVIVLSSRHPKEFKMTDQDWQRLGVVKFLYKPRTKIHHLTSEVMSLAPHAG
ncbi:MAG: response regulator [Candidatus Saccharimonadales bacterium]|nr:response regulator [Candidatus Saccharimonadales bacterium]